MRSFLPLILFFLGSCGPAGRPSRYLYQAEELSRMGQYDEAIQYYRKHMDSRLHIQTKPEWENPYFYMLLIGDIELGRGNPSEALKSYQLAEEANVDKALVSDRYRAVASWHEQNGELNQALEVLKAHRELDPLLFDAMLDRIAKELVRREDGSTLFPETSKKF